MRLRNKKTGEIIDDGYVRETHDFQFDGQKHVLAVFKGNGHRPPERVSRAYKSLAELNEEWEDYEEPKKFWYMTAWGDVYEYSQSQFAIKQKQAIGNYFESEEEAEKAVERLRAWKRLKDKGFRFRKWDWLPDQNIICGNIGFYIKDYNVDTDDLGLLFGGEE